MLIKQKQEKREKELAEFQAKTQTGKKDDLHQALLEIDRKTKAKAAAVNNNEEDGKRAQMYKNMRDEILREESKAKTDQQRQKIEQLNQRMAQLEKDRESREELEAAQEQKKKAAEVKKGFGNKSLLDNIKSFDVEDI